MLHSSKILDHLVTGLSRQLMLHSSKILDHLVTETSHLAWTANVTQF